MLAGYWQMLLARRAAPKPNSRTWAAMGVCQARVERPMSQMVRYPGRELAPADALAAPRKR